MVYWTFKTALQHNKTKSTLTYPIDLGSTVVACPRPGTVVPSPAPSPAGWVPNVIHVAVVVAAAVGWVESVAVSWVAAVVPTNTQYRLQLVK